MALFNRTKSESTSSTTAGAPTASTFDAGTAALSDLAGDYTIDPTHTRIGFSAKHAMVTTVRGQFNEFEGTVHVDTVDPSSSAAQLTMKSASFSTGVPDRDGHVTSADFLDVATYPELTFVTTDVAHDGGDTWSVTGNLTIKDVTKPVTIEFESTGSARDPFGNMRIGFEGATTINRKDWGLTWNAALETGGVLVSDKVKLEFDVSAIAVPVNA